MDLAQKPLGVGPGDANRVVLGYRAWDEPT